jgi:heme-degrading monooxygenase HmoA
MAARADKPWGYVIVWEFRPKAGAERLFEEAYGPKGIWAQFFRQGEGFVATELSQDAKDPHRYVTLDFWESKASYEKFRADRASDYARIDDHCETLTDYEREVGQFERVG